jgi:hypothetical protein
MFLAVPLLRASLSLEHFPSPGLCRQQLTTSLRTAFTHTRHIIQTFLIPGQSPVAATIGAHRHLVKLQTTFVNRELSNLHAHYRPARKYPQLISQGVINVRDHHITRHIGTKVRKELLFFQLFEVLLESPMGINKGETLRSR